jgi:hypothetical protein
VARLTGRTGDREATAAAWQDVLRIVFYDPEAHEQLRALGCELVFKRRDERGGDVFESTVDEIELVRGDPLPDTFVSRRVTNGDMSTAMRNRDPVAFREWFVSEYYVGMLAQSDATFFAHPAYHTSWRGAQAFAAQAHGRLLRPEEWEKLTTHANLYGIALLGPEWVDETSADAEGPVAGYRTLGLDGIVRGHYPFGTGSSFRYARDSWFREA